MTTVHPRMKWVGILLAAWIGLSISDANAQYGSGYNPYRPASSGGSYVPGVDNMRYSYNIWTRQITLLTPVGGNTYYSWPPTPGQSPITTLVPVGSGASLSANYTPFRGMTYGLNYTGPIGGANASASGYQTGGAYASPSAGRAMFEPNVPADKDNAAGIVLAERRAAPVEQPRNAFNRWTSERGRQAPPDPVQTKDDDLNRNLTQPELKDVISGEALNSILESLIAMPDKVKKTAPIVIEDSMLKRLNFTRGTGSIGLLRDAGRIVWPQALQSLAAIAPARREIETRFAEVYKQVADGSRADLTALDDLTKRVDRLTDKLTTDGKTLTFSENVAAKRFLASLEDSILFLKQPDAAEWLPGKCKLKADTVQDLVRIMADKRIRFAPALVGNDRVNISTHLMLVRLHKQATLNR